MNKGLMGIFMLLLVLIYACKQADTALQPEPARIEAPPETKETGDDEEMKVENQPQEISSEIQELISQVGKKVQSISYSYKGPQTNNLLYLFYVEGDKVRYIIDPTYKDLQLDEDSYKSIYLDKVAKTAEAYCDDRKCKVKGKKADLDYDEVYILTPLDWIESIEYAEKTGEELIEKRNTWKISTNKGIMWIDTFFGVPLQIESEGNKYLFMKMTFNDVEEADIYPT